MAAQSLPPPAPGSFDVNVKDFQGRSVVVKVNPMWDVARVKQEISKHTSVEPREFKLVFAGTTLADTTTLWDIGVQGYSTLHCIRGRAVEIQMAAPVKPLDHLAGDFAVLGTRDPTASLPTLQPETAVHASRPPATAHHHFYVYCKKPCGNMSPGKLRVRCATCKSTSFVLQGGPGGWEDVLTPRKLHGQCNREGCNGTDAEFYFKCGNHPTAENEECVALHMIRFNTVEVECATCSDIKDLVVVFNCDDQHSLCVDCFKQYCTHELTNRRFEECGSIGYTLKCPAKCDGSEIKESHHFRMLGTELYDRYQKFGTEEFILQMGGVLCPAPNCGQGLLPENQRERRVHCAREMGGCGFTFCRECKMEYHNGPCRQTAQAPQANAQQYQVDPQALQRSRWDAASTRFIDDNTKQCPRCRVPIEKNGGCMHMTCSRCRFEWCWICRVEWNRGCQSSHWFG